MMSQELRLELYTVMSHLTVTIIYIIYIYIFGKTRFFSTENKGSQCVLTFGSAYSRSLKSLTQELV